MPKSSKLLFLIIGYAFNSCVFFNLFQIDWMRVWPWWKKKSLDKTKWIILAFSWCLT